MPLTGGNVTTVVRVGDTVRRSAGLWTPAVHALLRHLEQGGFDAAPQVIGYDVQGREVLSYLEGDCPGYPLPAHWTTSELRCQVARQLRRMHDAQAGFHPPAGARWRALAQDRGSPEVVCHNDVAPHNTVLRADGSVAFIDWDFAGPGTRAYDVAHAAWKWVPLYSDTGSAEHGWPAPYDRPARLREFADAYGLTAGQRLGLVEVIRRRMVDTVEGIRRLARAGEPAFVKIWAEGEAAGPRFDIDLLDRERTGWERALR